MLPLTCGCSPLNLMVMIFGVVTVAFTDMTNNDLINEIMSRASVPTAVHLRGKLGPNGRFAPLHDDERPEDEAETIARDALRSAGLQNTTWEIVSHYRTKHNGATHIAMQQKVDSLMCSNCFLQCNVDSRGRVINLAYTAHVIEPVQDLTPSISPYTALAVVVSLWNKTVPSAEPKETKFRKTARGEELVEVVYGAMDGLSPEDVSISLTIIVTGTDETKLAWRVAIETEKPFHMYEVWVEAAPSNPPSTQVMQIIDLVNWDNWGDNIERAGDINQDHVPKKMKSSIASIPKPKNTTRAPSYEVYGIPHLDPTLGSRQVRDDIDLESSPLGWHDQGNGNSFTVTVGNNVCAQNNPTGSTTRGCIDTYRPDGFAELEFKFQFDQFADPKTRPTLDAAITNLFYWHNVHHDIFYRYGFDEPSGNFQENNFNQGGLGSDSVQANAQDGAGMNNANFATPIDGQRPRCRMYLWNGYTPFKDGDFDSGIIVHEIGHGVSNRLTGGPMTSGCLPTGQSGGMGEGWSDWWAVQLMQEERYRPEDAFPMGDYVRQGGIRNYPYSYDMDINPATFSYLSRTGYTGVHAIGSVWCGILHDVYWDMRASYGFSADWYDQSSGAGNIVLWKNVVDGLKLQPCRPTFVDARDAIILADEQNYEGRHTCVLWCGFARRGLGLSASTTGYLDRNPVEGYDAPSQCICESSLANRKL